MIASPDIPHSGSWITNKPNPIGLQCRCNSDGAERVVSEPRILRLQLFTFELLLGEYSSTPLRLRRLNQVSSRAVAGTQNHAKKAIETARIKVSVSSLMALRKYEVRDYRYVVTLGWGDLLASSRVSHPRPESASGVQQLSELRSLCC